MHVAEIMTRQVISVSPETTTAEAARLMLERHVSGLQVVDGDGAVLGILTQGDLLRRAETGTERHHSRWIEFLISPRQLSQEYATAHGRMVGEVMVRKVISVTPQDPITKVVDLMEHWRIKRLPVIEGERLVGIISRANLIRALLEHLPKPAAETTASDSEIRERILAEIAKEHWVPRDSVDVRVENGVAELYGSITDERERTALQVLAENVLGVKAVRDRLVWVEALSGFAVPAVGSKPPGSS